ncbi:MAG TPA: hypothetical protein VKQ29_08695 [Aliidongia sp.]|nr:hypothetical protein [Aliidongia sp.]
MLATACTTQLAPAYDQAISDGLIAANKDVQTLFATIGPGVGKETYPARADAYNNVIGELNALEIQAKARPIPDSIGLTEANKILSANGISQLTNDPKFTNYPSARSIDDASLTIATMRAADQKAGLHGDEIKAFQNQTSIFLMQAITYENFLKRGEK